MSIAREGGYVMSSSYFVCLPVRFVSEISQKITNDLLLSTRTVHQCWPGIWRRSISYFVIFIYLFIIFGDREGKTHTHKDGGGGRAWILLKYLS